MNPEEKMKYQGRLWIFYLLLGALFSSLLAGLAYQQLVRSEVYAERGKVQNHRRILTPGPRGNILDREGRILVSNTSRLSAVVFLSGAPVRQAFRKEYQVLKKEYELSGEEISNNDLQYEARANVIRTYLRELNQLLGREEDIDTTRLNKHFISNPLLPYPIINNLSQDEFAILLESLPVESPVQVYVSAMRHYPYGSAAAHTLGYVTSASLVADQEMPGEDLQTFPLKGSTGRNGVELRYDERLKGKTGLDIWAVDPAGFQVERAYREYPEKGSDLQLSLDIDLQLAGEKAFNEWEFIGCLVAIDIETSEILAMISKPDYDLNDTSPYISHETAAKIKEDGAWPNKALQGLYPPASPFKLVTAIAGLKSEVIDLTTTFECKGHMMIGGFRKHCHNRSGHGEVDLYSAIQKSCNVYFYETALRCGIDALAREAIYLNLDKPTEVDLPYEATRMLVPTKAWKKENEGYGWFSGDTANAAIGQGYLRITPLQMALMVGSIAKNKVLSNPSIIKKDAATLSNEPPAKPLGLNPRLHAALIEGMEMAAQRGGTGATASIDGLRLAGKTGTGEVWKEGGEVHMAWYVGFAPVEDPKIAIAVIIEGQELNVDFHGGTNAGPVARRVLQAYVDKNPDILEFPEPEVAQN